jgi:hypothetical protein
MLAAAQGYDKVVTWALQHGCNAHQREKDVRWA